MLKFVIRLFILTAFLFFGNFSFAQKTISGTIISDDGPVPFAVLELNGNSGSRQAMADDSGLFSFNDLTDSSYTLNVMAVGFEVHKETVHVGSVVVIHLKSEEIKEVVVYASRIGKREEEVVSVSVLSEKELQQQATINNNLNDILSKTTPGVAQSTESASNYGQGIRGRDMLVMLDGVPQSTPIRSASRELKSLDISSIGEVEIVRGATAVYGHGATGGVINFTTKSPKFKNDTVCFTTSVSGNSSFVFNNDAVQKKDPLGGRIFQQITGKADRFSFLANGAYEYIGKYYDAEGDLIPVDPLGQGGAANTNNLSLLGKVGYEINDKSGIELKGLYFNSIQKPGFISMGGEYRVQKAGTQFGNVYDDQLGTATKNLSFTLRYYNEELFRNTSFKALAYLQNNFARFPYEHSSTYFPPLDSLRRSAQSYISSDKMGIRIDFKTELPKLVGSTLTYGADLVEDNTFQKLTDGRIWVPGIRQYNLAPFLQAKIVPVKKLVLRAGLRNETVILKVNDYKQLRSSQMVQGGTLTYNKWLFNAGVRYNLHKLFSPYVSYGQGFATTEVGRELRGTAAKALTDLKPKPQVVNNYEFGWDMGLGDFTIQTAVFYNTSQYGVTIFGTSFDVQRAPEKIYGIESVVNYSLKKWHFNASASYAEGKSDPDGNGRFTDYLLGSRISPLKLTGSVLCKVSKKMDVGVQGLYSGNRNRFEGQPAGFGTGKVTDYYLVDLMVNYALWKGTFSMGINNFFNRLYFPPISQWAGSGSSYVAGRGRTINFTYTINY
ncbi:MAG: TonB-dependent receptor [Sporocytophaga sp.]|uniref:TonB-dependent receptor n=1 Tax=Sporocytophaga sp. TaxID=2231183 RepID=UPI001B0877AF|nr:TonB-dependent receptor [Sporocytophaga sp.]MBO9702781.1 TonB-dependent receptor [Sporocytophaga sp.]